MLRNIRNLMQHILTILTLTFVISMAAGCRTTEAPTPAPVVVTRTASPIKIDGKLDDKAWNKALVYQFKRPLRMSPTRHRQLGSNLHEKGSVRLLYDDSNLYVGFKFDDGDIIAFKDSDQKHHWKYGDMAEVFLKHRNKKCYYELYVTPHGRKTCWLIPACGLVELTSNFPQKPMPGMKTAARVDGTLNNIDSPDRSWSAEMKIPIAELEKEGGKFAPGTKGWTVLLTRHNYGKSIPAREPSTVPLFPDMHYHEPEQYAPLIIEP